MFGAALAEARATLLVDERSIQAMSDRRAAMFQQMACEASFTAAPNNGATNYRGKTREAVYPGECENSTRPGNGMSAARTDPVFDSVMNNVLFSAPP
jgi:hypothetical protein